jgi:hypothetical protein
MPIMAHNYMTIMSVMAANNLQHAKSNSIIQEKPIWLIVYK